MRDLETGETVQEDAVSAQDVLKEVQIALANATTDEQKDEAFRKLMYKYNEDGGIMMKPSVMDKIAKIAEIVKQI